VTLPLDARESASTPPDGAPEPQRAPKERLSVLVVDDNADAAESLADILRLGGHDVSTAGDGMQALDRLRRATPDLVFLDLGMPNMDGFEAARRIRSLPRGARILLVALTGWGSEADRRRTSETGFDRHLVKPVGDTEIAGILAEAIGRRAA
jgi:CheY-like chemotaxis protein